MVEPLTHDGRVASDIQKRDARPIRELCEVCERVHSFQILLRYVNLTKCLRNGGKRLHLLWLKSIACRVEDEERWVTDAGAIVHAELEPFRQLFQKTASSSPALTAIGGGTASFAIQALDTITGAVVGGGLPSALAGLGAGTVAQQFVEYLKASRDRRSAQAILDVALMFDTKK